jgi:hypothetical protein
VGDTAVEVTGGQYEEADITEEWCEDQMAAGLTLEEAEAEALMWIREEKSSGVRRQSCYLTLSSGALSVKKCERTFGTCAAREVKP